MSSPGPRTADLRIDEACDRFEAAWRGGARPRIEDALRDAPEADRPALFKELLGLELELRTAGGERPDPADYLGRFPDRGEAVRAVFNREMSTRPDGSSRAEPQVRPSSYEARFQILRPHARGGLGEVFVARDCELNREVALKQILHREADSPATRVRFLMEAEITGRLEHPGIVPVYSVGSFPDGRPYYAMRFIEGKTLKDVVAEFHADPALKADPGARALALSKLLRRFLDVCNTIDFAHSRGVIHRDIKPGNVIVGSYGETLVVDWGLAKPTGRGDAAGAGDAGPPMASLSGSGAETMPGSTLGTPTYMSPEQAAGDLDRVGPRSDVYSLGATLYTLLVGRPPVGGEDVGEVLRAVKEGRVVAPRRVDPGIDGGLEAICLKALAPEQGDRYATVRALAEDVERWLADEPVSARREPLTRRASRWLRKHRLLVACSVVGLVAGVIGLGALAVVQRRANRELADAREKTERALRAEAAANRKSQEALAASEAERKRSTAALAFVKNDVLAAARPAGQDGGLGVDATIRRALDAAEPKIARRSRDQPLVEAELRETIGLTYSYLRESSLAIPQLQRVLDLRRAALGPDHPDTLIGAGNLANALGDAGRLDEAIRLHEDVLRRREATLGAEHADTLGTRNSLANAYGDAGRFDEAVKIHERNVEDAERKHGLDHPDTLAFSHNLAVAYRDAGRIDEAIARLERVFERREDVLGVDHPDTLATGNALGLYYNDAKRTADAIRLLEDTLKRRERVLGPDHPDTLSSRNNLSLAYRADGRLDEALRLREETLRLAEAKLGPDHPDTLMWRHNLSTAYYAFGRLDEAIALGESTLRTRETKLGLDHPDTLFSRMSLAEFYRQAGRLGEALRLNESTLRLTESKLGADHPDTISIRHNLALAYEAQGQWADAEPLRRKVVELRRRGGEPTERLLANDLLLLGIDLVRQDRWADAEPVLRECVALCERLFADRWGRYHAMTVLGEALSGQGKFEEAESLILDGYRGMIAREDRIAPEARDCLTDASVRIIRLYARWDRPEDVRAWKPKLGLADLPADVFAPAAPGR